MYACVRYADNPTSCEKFVIYLNFSRTRWLSCRGHIPIPHFISALRLRVCIMYINMSFVKSTSELRTVRDISDVICNTFVIFLPKTIQARARTIVFVYFFIKN